MLIFANSRRNKREYDFETVFPKLWKALYKSFGHKKIILSSNAFYLATLEE